MVEIHTPHSNEQKKTASPLKVGLLLASLALPSLALAGEQEGVPGGQGNPEPEPIVQLDESSAFAARLRGDAAAEAFKKFEQMGMSRDRAVRLTELSLLSGKSFEEIKTAYGAIDRARLSIGVDAELDLTFVAVLSGKEASAVARMFKDLKRAGIENAHALLLTGQGMFTGAESATVAELFKKFRAPHSADRAVDLTAIALLGEKTFEQVNAVYESFKGIHSGADRAVKLSYLSILKGKSVGELLDIAVPDSDGVNMHSLLLHDAVFDLMFSDSGQKVVFRPPTQRSED